MRIVSYPFILYFFEFLYDFIKILDFFKKSRDVLINNIYSSLTMFTQ